MSKDIWHKADETPKSERYFIEHYKVVAGDKVYWKYGLFKGVSNYDYPFDQDTARWCYLDDLLALETDLERTRKALEMALDWLEQVATPAKCDDELCCEFTKRKLTEIKTALG